VEALCIFSRRHNNNVGAAGRRESGSIFTIASIIMTRTLLNDLTAIWQAAVAGVSPEYLVDESVRVDGDLLWCGDFAYPLSQIKKITIIGAGKASGKMAAAMEKVLFRQIDAGIVRGWVNVPENCVPENHAGVLRAIRLFGARPALSNEPTEAGVFGTKQMLQLVASGNTELVGQNIPLSQHLVICLLSGGGSALMPLPAEGVTLEQKLAMTRFLSASGATIDEMNTVRKQLSAVKGGMLKRFCRGTTLVGLILSDVLGDPLDIIASGPTVDNRTTAADALAVLEKYRFSDSEDFSVFGDGIVLFLRQKDAETSSSKNHAGKFSFVWDDNLPERVQNLIIGNNAAAVDAAGLEADRRGYPFAMICATASEGDAEPLGEHLLETALRMSRDCLSEKMDTERSHEPIACLISGGEPTVKLVAAKERGLGGRNQQLVLAAICKLFADSDWMSEFRRRPDETCHFAFLSGGTDGEDGPTDAAGAFFDAGILQKTLQLGLDPRDYLQCNDAYHFFEQVGGLIKTGPTGTNVCDVRVILVLSCPGHKS